MKTVYISVPITGREIEEVKKHISFVTYTYLSEYKIINPLELAKTLAVKNMGKIVNPTYGEYIGSDMISLIDNSDAVFFCRGWHESKGCQLEFTAAKIYGKEIMFE